MTTYHTQNTQKDRIRSMVKQHKQMNEMLPKEVNTDMTERELVQKYKEAKIRLEQLKIDKAQAEKDFTRIQEQLVEDLKARDAKSTANYEGIGRISLEKPRLFANVLKENQDFLFDYLKSIERDDLIKPNVHPSTLSSFVGEMVLEGKEVPDFITVSYKTTTRITA